MCLCVYIHIHMTRDCTVLGTSQANPESKGQAVRNARSQKDWQFKGTGQSCYLQVDFISFSRKGLCSFLRPFN